MRSGVLTVQPGHGRGALRPVLVTGGAALALALFAAVVGLSEPVVTPVGAERGVGECSRIVRGSVRSEGTAAQHSCMQPRSAVLHEQDAIAGASPTSSLPQQVLAARGRAKFQPHTQSVIRLVRERQDAIITAFSHRMRDASEPGAASHSADRPLIVTRPLRGPPAQA